MSRITNQMAKGWAETTKFPLGELDTDLLDQIETEVLATIASAYDTSTWVDETTTPVLVQTALAKIYVAWKWRKSYSEDEGTSNEYADKLEANGNLLVAGIIGGTLPLPGATAVDPAGASTPGFYPSDESSSQCPTIDDPSLGPARFSMGMTF